MGGMCSAPSVHIASYSNTVLVGESYCDRMSMERKFD